MRRCLRQKAIGIYKSKNIAKHVSSLSRMIEFSSVLLKERLDDLINLYKTSDIAILDIR